MRINNNLQAMNAQRNFMVNNVNQNKSAEKLSSGLRINKAGDDAAGLAISEKMRGQIRGLNQATRNTRDAISLVQTADGGAESIHNMLQRMRELSVQAANDTLKDEDRVTIQGEVSELIAQIGVVSNNTEYNSLDLLNSDGTSVNPSIITDLNDKIPKFLNDALVLLSDVGKFDIALPGANIPMAIEYVDNSSLGYAAAMGTIDGTSLTLFVNIANVTDGSGNLLSDDILDGLIAHEMMHGLEFSEMDTFLNGGMSLDEIWVAEGLSMLIQGGNSFLVDLTNNSDATIGDAWTGSIADYAESYLAMRTLHEITDGGIDAFIDRLELGDTLDQAINNTTQDNSAEVDPGADFTTFDQFKTWFNTSGAVDTYLDTADEFINGTGAVDDGVTQGSDSNLSLAATIPNLGLTDTLNAHYTLDFTNASAALGSALEFQIGANTGQSISFSTKNLSANALGINGLNISTIDGASGGITQIDSAIDAVSVARGYFGAVQNRLEHIVKNVNNSSENLIASESRIRDIDMAKEMMSFSKNNILIQAAQSMLAQANQAPKGVLQLLM